MTSSLQLPRVPACCCWLHHEGCLCAPHSSPTSPPASPQLLDSLVSTYDEDRLAVQQHAAASLHHQRHDPYTFTAAAPVGHPYLHGSTAPFAGYGSQQQHSYSASLPPRPPMATRPSSSIAFGGQGHVLGGGLPPLPRPAASGAVFRSTSEWGQLSATQKEAAQVRAAACSMDGDQRQQAAVRLGAALCLEVKLCSTCAL